MVATAVVPLTREIVSMMLFESGLGFCDSKAIEITQSHLDSKNHGLKTADSPHLRQTFAIALVNAVDRALLYLLSRH